MVEPKKKVMRLKVIAKLYSLSGQQIIEGCDIKMHRNYIINGWNGKYAFAPAREESIRRFLRSEGIAEELVEGAFEIVDEAEETAKLAGGELPEPPNPDEKFLQMGVVLMRSAVIEHFGLSRDPFQQYRDDTPYKSKAFTRCENLVRDAIANKMMAAITGPTGVGKSVLLTHIFQSIANKPGYAVATIRRFDKELMKSRDIYTAILRDLDGITKMPSTEVMHRLVEESLEQHCRRKIIPVVHINEAHDMSDEGLIKTKRLWEAFTARPEMGYARACAVVFVAQERFYTRLTGKGGELREVQQRLHLEKYGFLERLEVGPYIAHRFRVDSGAFERIWDEQAVEYIAQRSLDLTPGLVNVIASNAMNVAYRLNSKQVTSDHAQMARDDVIAA